LGIAHRSIFKMVVDHQQEIAKTTSDGFGRGRPSSSVLLTEDQTYAYMAYSQNHAAASAS